MLMPIDLAKLVEAMNRRDVEAIRRELDKIEHEKTDSQGDNKVDRIVREETGRVEQKLLGTQSKVSDPGETK